MATAAMVTAAAGSPGSDALRARASTELYNLQQSRAGATYREAIAADPNDAAAYRGLAGTLWISIAFARGTMTVDSYLGRVSRDKVVLAPPPAEVTAEFNQAIEKALALSRARLAAHPDDPDATFELGAAIGLRASYIATIEGGVVGAFRAAKEAYDAHERVLELRPDRRDAGLIVGMYRYLIADLSMPMRWMAYAVGFGGGRDKGMQLIEQAADYPGDNQSDARLALVLIYNREGRYDEALAQLEKLRARHPQNRLLWLETGATFLRAGRHAEAEAFFSEGIARMRAASGARMFGEAALWHYKRGATRAALGKTAEARADLATALASVPARNWVLGRAHFELGKIERSSGQPDAARPHLETAVRLCNSDRDGATADEARKLIR
jgi:tetratricopeptide (TPR) repeat protein